MLKSLPHLARILLDKEYPCFLRNISHVKAIKSLVKLACYKVIVRDFSTGQIASQGENARDDR